MKPSVHNPRLRCGLLVLLMLVLLALTACGSPGLRNEAPQVKIDGMEVDDRQLVVEIGIRNINSRPMVVERLRSSLTMQGRLVTDQFELGPMEVPANTREVFPVHLTASSELAAIIAFKSTGRQGALSYEMDGRIVRDGERDLFFEAEGRLFAVPGRSDRFR